MSSRIENLVNRQVKKKASAKFDVPAGTSRVQIVLDRVPFEDLIQDGTNVCDVTLMIDGEYAGRVWWDGGRVEGRKRPGQRQLWSTGYWQIPVGAKKAAIVVNTAKSFFCHIDVDFF
jgi:xanthine dehydrogenase molybdopterin-binding subunit B